MQSNRIRFYLPFSDWYGTANRQCPFAVPQINRCMINTIWFRLDQTRFGLDFSVCVVAGDPTPLIIIISRPARKLYLGLTCKFPSFIPHDVKGGGVWEPLPETPWISRQYYCEELKGVLAYAPVMTADDNSAVWYLIKRF